MHYDAFKRCIEHLQASELLAPDCRIYPSGQRIYRNIMTLISTGYRLLCCGVALPELHRTRQKLDRIEELDLTLLNGPLGAVGSVPSTTSAVTQKSLSMCALLQIESLPVALVSRDLVAERRRLSSTD